MNTGRSSPRFPLIVLGVAIFGLLVTGWLSVYVVQQQGNEKLETCKRVVQTREDSRAMWIYLLDSNKDAPPDKVEQFRNKLNELIPPLKCEGEDWVPRGDN